MKANELINKLIEKLSKKGINPLTSEELKLMYNKQSVYCVNGAGQCKWCLIDKYGNGIDNETGLWDINFYGMTVGYGENKDKLHGMGWLAYLNMIDYDETERKPL